MATKRPKPSTVPEPEAVETDEDFEKSARKAPKAKAPAAEPVLNEDGTPVKKGRSVKGDRNHLARAIDEFIRNADKPVVVREIAAGITYTDGTHPSSGAVAAALTRWAEQGYIEVNPKPLGFTKFVGRNKANGFSKFQENLRETRAADRKAAREAAAA